MTVSATNTTPRFFGFSVVSGNYTAPASKADCEKAFFDHKGTKISYYESVRNTLAQKLAKIFGADDIPRFPIKDGVFYKTVCKDVCKDSVESNIAYKFYAHQIINKINELDGYIKEAQGILENYTDNKLTRLQVLDTFCKKIEIEFSHYYSYDQEEAVFKVIEECSKEMDGSGKDNANYSKTQLNDNKPESYAALRNDQVSTYLNKENTKTIECFNELNLLDRLKFIKLYYDCESGKTDALFPNDKKEESYPAVSVPKSMAYNKETYTTGQLELFYIGYLVDRDGPIGALCSFIEFKSVSLLKNIEIESLRIKAINAYLTYLNQASMNLNAREEDAGIPATTYGIVALVCNGIARNIKKLTIDGHTYDYLVLQRDYTNGDKITSTHVQNGYHLSKTNYYILVRLDVGVSEHVTALHADSPFVMKNENDGRGINTGNEVTNVTDPSTEQSFVGISFYQGFSYSTFDCTNSNQKNEYELLIAKSDNCDAAINFLPKELDITTISMESIYGYIGNISWKDSKTDDNKEDYTRMITNWQTVIDNYKEKLNTALESINSDIDVWRSKMNTWDGLANKIRHRDYEIRQNLMSRALK